MNENNIFPPFPPKSEKDSFVHSNFDYIKHDQTREMVENGYRAVSELALWDYMKKSTDSYMLSKDPEINLISKKMTELGYEEHSGLSFAWTMRQLQSIAINGEDKYKQIHLQKNK
jgi:hypothetical protein